MLTLQQTNLQVRQATGRPIYNHAGHAITPIDGRDSGLSAADNGTSPDVFIKMHLQRVVRQGLI